MKLRWAALPSTFWACLAVHGCGGQVEESANHAGQAGTGGTDAGIQDADAEDCGVILASDYDQSCTTVDDCVLVFEGDTCAAATNCSCPNALISRTALAGYHPVFGDSGMACMCVMVGEPVCVGGICVMSRGPDGG
jgi:hypothetical protein